MPITICFLAIQNQIEGMKKAQSFKYSQAMYRRSISLILKTAVANSHLTVGSMDEGGKKQQETVILSECTLKCINKIENAF